MGNSVEYAKQYFQDNKERIRLRNLKRRHASPEELKRLRDASKKYKRTHRERVLAYQQIVNKQGWPKRKKARKLATQAVWDYKLKHPCVDCSESNPILLEFDHVRGKKKFSISEAGYYAWASVLNEIAKCEVRCVSCHRKKTFFQLKLWKRLRKDQRPGGGQNG